jgi:hypothetical protein
MFIKPPCIAGLSGRLIFGTTKFGVAKFFYVALQPNAGHGFLILEVSTSYTTQHNR